ncbi:hypothetical protein, partial [Flagellimonas alvinocaridis]|uniref:hypothetical protein n=1 Tax=Flagellimonas alvinocaridis TaxID=2530200 RepID=UPI001F2DAC45
LTKKALRLFTDRSNLKVVHFGPARVGHFRPASYGHFNPARVVYYVRRFQVSYKSGQHFLIFQIVIRFVDVFNQNISILMIFLKTEKPVNHTINRFLL